MCPFVALIILQYDAQYSHLSELRNQIYGFYFEDLPDERFQPVQTSGNEYTTAAIPSNPPAITKVSRQLRSESLTLLISKYLALPRPGSNDPHGSNRIAQVLFRWFAHFHGSFRVVSIKTIRVTLPNSPDGGSDSKSGTLDLRLTKGGTLIVHSLFQERWPFLFEVRTSDALDRKKSQSSDRPWNGCDLIEFWIGMMRTWTGKQGVLSLSSSVK
jgi:hypothetical protein